MAIKYSQRTGQKLNIALFDSDHFKRVNDEHRRQYGDKVLMTFAKTCIGETRHTDVLGRVGGEEFLLILPAMNSEGAGQICFKIKPQLFDDCAALKDDFFSLYL